MFSILTIRFLFLSSYICFAFYHLRLYSFRSILVVAGFFYHQLTLPLCDGNHRLCQLATSWSSVNISISQVPLFFFSDTFQEVKSKRDKKKEVSQPCSSNICALYSFSVQFVSWLVIGFYLGCQWIVAKLFLMIVLHYREHPSTHTEDTLSMQKLFCSVSANS